jgi:hypothetical protein
MDRVERAAACKAPVGAHAQTDVGERVDEGDSLEIPIEAFQGPPEHHRVHGA